MKLESLCVLITLVFAIVIVSISYSVVRLAAAQQVALDMTKTVGDKPFGGEKICQVIITVNGHVVDIVANMTSEPNQGMTWEGWLVDAGGSDYKLSLGEFSKNGTLHVTKQMVNPHTYSQFVISEEPFEDVDPNAAGAFGGAELQMPFGR